MNIRKNLLLCFILCSNFAWAQKMQIDVVAPSVVLRHDSATISMNISCRVSEMESRNVIRITPVLTDGEHSVEFPQVLLNGNRAHQLYQRTKVLNKRRGKADDRSVFTAIPVEEAVQSVKYRASASAAHWMQMAKVQLKKEVLNGHGRTIQSETVPVSGGAEIMSKVADAALYEKSVSVAVAPKETVATFSPKKHFRGSYVSPQSDETDERNQKELNFSLEEAQIIAQISPQMLSLRELYTVAISYKNNMEQFYKIIDLSVKIYPANPIANLNAAAAAIERGNTQDAGRYLQMASHDTLAYKNCRGAYELLCNNTYEGIRLLKSAKAEGSEEAAYNLNLFFESNKNNMQ